MSEVARLTIKIDSLSAEIARLRLDKVTGASRRTQRATTNLGAGFAKAGAAAVVLATAVKGLQVVTDVATRFQDMEARLVTATGSMDGAKIAMQAIKDLAVETPYDIEQITNGFIRLANLGLSPSEAALRSYGNTASATGKSLNQMIEAAADAATFEFERLKEFGIKANQMGDRVSFTFRGVTTTVEKSSKAVTQYLTELGETKFEGEMARRMETLGGAASNMQDQFSMAMDNIGKAGLADAIEDGFRKATTALETFNVMMESGEMGKRLELEASRWDYFADQAEASLNYVTGLWDEAPEGWKASLKDVFDYVVMVYKYMPENATFAVKRIGLEFRWLYDSTAVIFDQLDALFANEFARWSAIAEAHGKDIRASMNPFSDGKYDLEKDLNAINAYYDKSNDKLLSGLGAVNKARDESMQDIIIERGFAIASYDIQSANVKKLSAAYIKAREERKKAMGDRLAQFGQDESEGKSLAQQRADEKAAKASQKAFKTVKQGLRSEEEVILESYQRRWQIILDNTQAGSDARNNLQERLNAEFSEQTLGESDEAPSFDDRLAKLTEFYDLRRKLIMDNVELTEAERTELESKLTKQRNTQLNKLETERNSFITSTMSGMFDDLSTIAAAFGGKQNKLYKVMFAASKAFAIADSLMKIQQGIANASALPWPANLGAIASTVAATTSIVSNIQSVRMQGFRKGGYTGDRGTNDVAGVVHGQEYVFDAAATRRIGKDNLDKLRQGQSREMNTTQATGSANLTVVNNIYTDQGLSVETKKNDQGGQDIYVTKEEFSGMLAMEAGNVDSDMNQALDALFARERAS